MFTRSAIAGSAFPPYLLRAIVGCGTKRLAIRSGAGSHRHRFALVFHNLRRCRHEQDILRQISRHGDRQHRSASDRPDSGDGAGCRRFGAGQLGDALRSGRGQQQRYIHRCRSSAPACGSSSNAAIQTARSGSAAIGTAPRKSRNWPRRCRPAYPASPSRPP